MLVLVDSLFSVVVREEDEGWLLRVSVLLVVFVVVFDLSALD